MLLMSGLGGDRRVAIHQTTLHVDLILPDYIPFLEGEMLPAYAKRFYRYLVEDGTIDPSRPLVLSGMSMGGALAQEMSRHCDAIAVVLLGSFRSSNEIHPLVRWFGRSVVGHVPASVLHAFTPVVYLVMRLFSGLPHRDVRIGAEMYRDTDKVTFRREFRALTQWDGCEVHGPMLRIHGASDPLIPLSRTQSVDLVVPKAKHLVAVAAPKTVNTAIEKFLATLLE